MPRAPPPPGAGVSPSECSRQNHRKAGRKEDQAGEELPGRSSGAGGQTMRMKIGGFKEKPQKVVEFHKLGVSSRTYISVSSLIHSSQCVQQTPWRRPSFQKPSP